MELKKWKRRISATESDDYGRNNRKVKRWDENETLFQDEGPQTSTAKKSQGDKHKTSMRQKRDRMNHNVYHRR